MRPPVGQALDALRDLVYPVRCPFCDEVLGTLRECPACKTSAEKLFHRPFRLAETEHQLELVEGAASLYEYDGCVQAAIQRMKFSGRPGYARWFADEMAEKLFGCTFGQGRAIINLPFIGHGRHTDAVVPPVQEYDVIIPVPPSNLGQWYNSPTLLAKQLARRLELPCETSCLYKRRKTPNQVGLNAEQRLVNLHGAFDVRDVQRIEGKRVLLVDDVITTGATLHACAQALLQNGAESVFAVSIAASELHETFSAKNPENNESE